MTQKIRLSLEKTLSLDRSRARAFLTLSNDRGPIESALERLARHRASESEGETEREREREQEGGKKLRREREREREVEE